MRKTLGPHQHKAWATLLTRHSKIFRLIEKDLQDQEGLLPLHLYDVLLALKNSPTKKLRLSEIADEIVTSRSALSRSVDKLESLSYLKKEKATEDGRGQFAEITAKGLKALSQTWPSYEAAIHQHFGARLTDEDCERLVTILSKLDQKN